MRERLEHRLDELRRDFQEGQRMIADLEAKLTNTRSTVLRIAGAIQVLEEELARPVEAAGASTPASESLKAL